MLAGLATQTNTNKSVHGWLNTLLYRIKVAKASAYVCVQKTYMSPINYLTKSKGTRTKNAKGGRSG